MLFNTLGARAREAKILFYEAPLRDALEMKQRELQAEISSIEDNRLLNTSTDDLIRYCVDKYSVTPITLKEADVYADETSVRVDVRDDPYRMIRDRSRPALVEGMRLTIHVPFDGDPGLFRFRPNEFDSAPPQGEVRDGEVILTFETASPDAEQLKRQTSGAIESVRKYIGRQHPMLAEFNNQIAASAKKTIEARKDRLLKQKGIAAEIGIPLRKRDGAGTFAAPVKRKRIEPRLPPATTSAFKPEPALASEDYEQILDILQNMVVMMERSPATFVRLSEPELRDHFLVQLNGIFEGSATGETFNAAGKTDILIRRDGNNIFIAECKFWDGPKSLADALDQLLSYTTWRDGKIALLVFNRAKNFSRVVQQIPDLVRGHALYKRNAGHRGETGWRFVFARPSDPDREVLLTVLAFDIPSAAGANTA